MSNKTATPQPPTGLYQGYDSFQGQVRNAAVSGTSNQVNASSTNLVSVCTDTESVMRAISVSASLSGSLFDVSFDTKASWAQQLNLTSTSVAVVVHSVVVTGQNQADSYSLAAAPPSSLQDFFTDYGDSFVSEVVLGGEYYAAFVFNSSSVSQQQQITASLSGSYGGITGSLSTAISNASSSTQTSLSMSQQMLGVSDPTFPSASPDDIVNFALGFGGSSQTINAPTVLCYSTTGYEHVAGISGFDAIVANRNLLGTASAAPFVEAFTTLTTMSTQCALLQQMYTAYQYSSDSLFATNAQQVSNDLAALNTLIAGIEGNVTGTFSAPPLPSLGYGVPLVTYTLNPQGAPGYLNTTGSFFDLSPTQIANGVMPGTITLYSSVVEGLYPAIGIEVRYSDGTSTSHGNTGGSVQGTLSLQGGDTIASVAEAFAGSDPFTMWVTAMQIQTARRQSLGSIPSGFSVGASYSAPPLIIGFCGAIPVMASNTVNPLIPISITLSPALWVHPISAASAKSPARARARAQVQASA